MKQFFDDYWDILSALLVGLAVAIAIVVIVLALRKHDIQPFRDGEILSGPDGKFYRITEVKQVMRYEQVNR